MNKFSWYSLLFIFIQSDVIFADRYDTYFVKNLSVQYHATQQSNNSFSLQQPFQSRAPFKINRSTSKKQQKAEFELYLNQRTDTYLQAGKDFFKGDITPLEKVIKKAIEDQTIDQPDVMHSLQYQAISHLIKTGQTDCGKVRSYKNHPWMQQHNLQNVSMQDQIMLNYFIARVSQKSNDTTVELVQAGLQGWDKAMETTNLEEKIAAQQLYTTCYNLLQNSAQPKNLACGAVQVTRTDMQNLLDSYSLQIDDHYNNFVGVQVKDTDYFDRLEKRKQALFASQQKQPKSSANYINSITNNALGLMQACNINYASFNNINCNEFQHCLTKEIIDIVNAAADMASRNNYQSMITQFVQYNCNLAVSAQQLNQLSYVEQAAVITDMSHLFNLYCKYVLDDQFCMHAWQQDTRIGISTGIARALWGWKKFADKLYDEPAKTVGKLADDCYGVAHCLYSIAATVGSMPFAYLDDLTLDMQDHLHALQSGDSLYSSSRMTVRMQHNMKAVQDGYFVALDVGQAVVASITQKPFQENIADITQLTVDGMITSKITNSLLILSQFVGGRLVQAGGSIRQMIPPDILDSSMSFMQTSSGELIAVANATGENIGAAVASVVQTIAESSTPFFQYAPQAKLLADKIEKITQANKEEVAALRKSVEPYLRTDKIVNVERLKSIEGVEQIKKFKDFTKNFHPDEVAKLHPDEILYLNLCDWLEPQAIKINAQLKASGGIKLFDKVQGVEVIFDEFDIFHSLLGEMKPGSVKDATKGGHWFLAECKAATFDVGEITSFGNGFFDLPVKHLRGLSAQYVSKSCFPVGNSIEQCTNIVKEAIENPLLLEYIKPTTDSIKQTFRIVHQSGQRFILRIENKKAQFYPLSPLA